MFWFIMLLLGLNIAMSIATRNWMALLGWISSAAMYIKTQVLEDKITALIMEDQNGKK